MLSNKRHHAFSIVTFCALLFCLALSSTAWADAVSEATARTAAMNWLQEKANHMEETLGDSIESIKLYRGGQSGTVGYYLVTFSPNGWLILPADDEYWPVQSFGPGKITAEEFETTIWYAVTSFNKSNSLVHARGAAGNNEGEKIREKNQKRWEDLLSTKPQLSPRGGTSLPSGNNADIRVPILLTGNEAKWGQGPPFNVLLTYGKLTEKTMISPDLRLISSPPDPYVVGCTITAMSQVMSHLANVKYPSFGTTPRSTHSKTERHIFEITRDYGSMYGGVRTQEFDSLLADLMTRPSKCHLTGEGGRGILLIY